MSISGNGNGDLCIRHASGRWIIRPKPEFKDHVNNMLRENFKWFSYQKTFGFGMINKSSWKANDGVTLEGAWENLTTGKIQWE